MSTMAQEDPRDLAVEGEKEKESQGSDGVANAATPVNTNTRVDGSGLFDRATLLLVLAAVRTEPRISPCDSWGLVDSSGPSDRIVTTSCQRTSTS